ncbi:MAG: hypothetical protein BGN96_02615 [Bacteroidales bacterium 45-6]|nr:MAG: hypothetical protein BGN96_02615 [Bacteroidales bacterium 45-6]
MEISSKEKFIIEESYPYLEAFLLEDDSFYPFAMILTNKMIARPIDPDIQEEFPSSEYLIDLLEYQIRQRLYEEQYILGVICIDLLFDSNQNGVEFRLISSSSEKKLYLKYTIEDNKVQWMKP